MTKTETLRQRKWVWIYSQRLCSIQ